MCIMSLHIRPLRSRGSQVHLYVTFRIQIHRQWTKLQRNNNNKSLCVRGHDNPSKFKSISINFLFLFLCCWTIYAHKFASHVAFLVFMLTKGNSRYLCIFSFHFECFPFVMEYTCMRNVTVPHKSQIEFSIRTGTLI